MMFWVPNGPLRPLVLVDSDAGPLLYLDRYSYFRQEQLIRQALVACESTRLSVDVTTAGLRHSARGRELCDTARL
jgi:hypothetical protein